MGKEKGGGFVFRGGEIKETRIKKKKFRNFYLIRLIYFIHFSNKYYSKLIF